MFSLPFSPEELDTKYAAFLDAVDGKRGMIWPRDIHLIAPMVRHLATGPTYSEAGSYAPKVTRDGTDEAPQTKLVHYYACTHLRPNGDCAIYARRPEMCREFPYSERCPYASCTCRAAREGNLGAPLSSILASRTQNAVLMALHLEAAEAWR